MDVKEKVSKAKARLLLNQPFYGTLLLSTDLSEDDKIPSACTNGVSIRYNPKWFDTLTPEQVQGVLQHEILHIVFLHCDRLKRKDAKLWNVATDYAINLLINYNLLPKEVLRDSQWEGKAAEEIYDKLPKDVNVVNISVPGPCGGSGKSGQGKGLNGKVIDELQPMPGGDETRAEIESKVIVAYEATKDKGDLPAGLTRYFEELRKSRVKWSSIFMLLYGHVPANIL